MKSQQRIRVQMLMVGLGAALLMAGSARAQQDVDPTYFDMNPGAPAASKVAVAQAAARPVAAKNNGQTESALALASSNEATLEASVTRMGFVDAGIALILLTGVFSIVAYALAATRRERSFRVSSVSARYTPASAATT